MTDKIGDKREIYRYLGYGKAQPEDDVKEMVEEVAKEVEKAADFKYGYRRFPMEVGEDGLVSAPCFTTKSKNLAKNLGGCQEFFTFAATLGIGCDQLIRKYTRLSMSRAVAVQAASAALLEELCNHVWKELAGEMEDEGYFLRPRFSPGYGDFSLECQEALLDSLEAGKRMGIKLTDSFLMMPSKSITAVIGISTRPGRCRTEGCEVCQKTDCPYRR